MVTETEIDMIHPGRFKPASGRRLGPEEFGQVACAEFVTVVDDVHGCELAQGRDGRAR